MILITQLLFKVLSFYFVAKNVKFLNIYYLLFDQYLFIKIKVN